MADLAGLIHLQEAQKRLPGNPSIRWISTEARRLGCYRRVGKEAYIIERAWQSFVEGEPYEPDVEKRLFALASDGRHWVYFIANGDAVKIGIANDVFKRHTALQVGSSSRLRLIGLVDPDKFSEGAVHARFAHLRIRGEWFWLKPEIIDFFRENGHG
jgi:hypothetical protein